MLTANWESNQWQLNITDQILGFMLSFSLSSFSFISPFALPPPLSPLLRDFTELSQSSLCRSECPRTQRGLPLPPNSYSFSFSPSPSPLLDFQDRASPSSPGCPETFCKSGWLQTHYLTPKACAITAGLTFSHF